MSGQSAKGAANAGMGRNLGRAARFAGVAGFALAAAVASSAKAQDTSAAAGGTQVEELIVTATKRSENVQDVPIAVTALSAKAIEDLGMEGGLEIADNIPNFSVQGLWGPASAPFLNIRGVSFIDFSFVNEASVSLYTDGVYQTAQGAATGQLFDLQQVEVLRGPQGTLFGRNTTGGLVHFISRKPTSDTLNGYASAQYGSYNQLIVEGAIGGALSDTVRFRLAGKSNRDDGYSDNRAIPGSTYGVTNVQGVRGTLQWDATPQTLVEISAHYSRSTSTAPGYGFIGTRDPVNGTTLCSPSRVLANQCSDNFGFRDPDPKPTHTYSEATSLPNEFEGYGGYINITHDLGWAELVSITATESFAQLIGQDFDASARIGFGIGFFDSTSRMLTQELRLAGEGEKFKWIVGGYFYDDRKQFYSVDTDTGSSTETRSYAGFAQVDYDLSDTLTATLGGRYTSEHRELTSLLIFGTPSIGLPGIQREIDDQEVTGQASLQWRPRDNTMLYGSYSRGFKSGGYNGFTFGVATLGPAEAEKVDNFEVGLKAEWLDRTLRTNVSLFHYEFKGMQAQAGVLDPVTNRVASRFFNIGDAAASGAEVEVTYAPTPALDFTLNIGVIDSKIEASPLLLIDGRKIDGSRLPSTPEFSLDGIVQYHHDMQERGVVTLQTDFRYQTGVYFGPDNNPYEFQDAFGVVNFRARWNSADDKYNAEVFVENATNEVYAIHAFQSTGAPAAFQAYGMPRWFGVRIGASF